MKKPYDDWVPNPDLWDSFDIVHAHKPLEQPPSPASYIIFKVGEKTFAKNGKTGAIEFSDTDATSVIQAAINAGEGTIFVKKARYVLTSQIVVGQNNRHIMGEPGTVFESSLLPCFSINGGAVDTDNVLRGISLENIRFQYTGADANGHFVYIGGLQSDKWYQGGSFFRNIIIDSGLYSDVNLPNNENFIGLKTDMLIGVTFDYINIRGFGTGWRMTYRSGQQGSHTIINQAHISVAKYGVWNDACETCQTWNALKVMHCRSYGFIAMTNHYPRQLTFNNPQFESLTGASACLDVKSQKLFVFNGVFSAYSGGIGIKFHDPADSADTFAYLINNNFSTGSVGIKTASKTFVFGNKYSNVTTPIYLNGANAKLVGDDETFKFINSGTATFSGDGTTKTFTIAHGLAAAPSVVFLEAKSADAAGDKYWSADATNITVTFKTAPPSGSNNVILSWKAEV